MGSKEDVAARIEADTRLKIEEMNQTVTVHKNSVRSHGIKRIICRERITKGYQPDCQKLNGNIFSFQFG